MGIGDKRDLVQRFIDGTLPTEETDTVWGIIFEEPLLMEYYLLGTFIRDVDEEIRRLNEG